MAKEGEIKGTYQFSIDGPQLTSDDIQRKFPGVKNNGHLGKTGVVLHDTAIPIAAIRHPRLIPTRLDGIIPVFGGPQTHSKIEHIRIRPAGGSEAKRIAKAVRGTTPTLGPEAEAFVHNRRTGRLVPTFKGKQIETQKALREDALGHTGSLEEHIVASAKFTVFRANQERRRGRIAVETSVPITYGEGKDARDSEGLAGSENPYIVAMTHLFPENMLPTEKLDPQVASVLNQYALRHGFATISDMTSALGLNRTWHMAASHLSLGLPQEQQPDGKYITSTEIAIGVMNVFMSDLNISHMFTHGTPMLGGQLVDVPARNRQSEHVASNQPLRDVRLGAFKHMLGTAYPGPLIANEEDLYDRWRKIVIPGKAATVDRASAISIAPNGEIYASMHARARLRVGGDPTKQTVRVESVGDSATPSRYDLIARDAYLVMLWNGAMEAMAKGKTPQDFWGGNYPAITDWKKQQEATLGFSVNGPANREAHVLIEQNLGFLRDMKALQPTLGTYIDYVTARIRNFSRPTKAHTLDEYTTDPSGSISEVIRRMKETGYKDDEIVRAIDTHQTAVSRRVVQVHGDFKALLQDVQK